MDERTIIRRLGTYLISGVALLSLLAAKGMAQGVVPGTGVHLTKVGDDFEDPKWGYKYNLPKNSYELDKQDRLPASYSLNGRWFEGPLRGTPDLVKRVDTPAGGLPGSRGALVLRTLNSGRPGILSFKAQQDDFIANVKSRVGGMLPVAWSPNVVVRVFVPPLDQWEKRSGTSFAFRAGVHGHKANDGWGKTEDYWPGILFNLYRGDSRKNKPDRARLRMRAGPSGRDVEGPEIKTTGWWTLGMTFTPDGRVHYYAHAGVDDLTSADHIGSHYPYGNVCRQFETFFFDVLSNDDGHTWSTEWIIDDPELYVVKR